MIYRFVLLLWLLASQSLMAEPIRIAVAANFSAPLQALVDAYQHQHPQADIRISSGSSGKLYAQIQHGAPFDVLLSADRHKPEALVKQGLASRAHTYAIGRLALWSAQEDIDVLARLKQGHVERLAMANPRLAPYGLAAQQTLLALNLPAAISQGIRERMVLGENVSQTHQFVATANADMGFVAVSHIHRAQQTAMQWPGSVWLVPDVLHQPIRQDLAIIRHRRQSQKQYQQAQQLVQFLLSAKAQPLLTAYGYRSPHAD